MIVINTLNVQPVMPQFRCVSQCGRPCDSDNRDFLLNVTTERWETIRNKSREWRSVDKFGHVFDSDDWDKGPRGQCLHGGC